jgi:hypothetical protein
LIAAPPLSRRQHFASGYFAYPSGGTGSIFGAAINNYQFA